MKETRTPTSDRVPASWTKTAGTGEGRMKKCTGKKILSVILACLMVVSLVPFTAEMFKMTASAADAPVNFSTAAAFNQAVANATGPITMRLTADINVSNAPITPGEYAYTSGGHTWNTLNVPQGKQVTLDLNGHNLLWINHEKNSEWFLSHGWTQSDNGTDYDLGTFMGLIKNSGQLEITGSGTIENLKIDLDSKITVDSALNQRFCTIYNAGTGSLKLGNQVNVKMFASFAEQSAPNQYNSKALTCSMFLSGIFNEDNARVESRANISVGSFNALRIPGSSTSASSWSSNGTTFCYAIYGGKIIVKGGNLNCEAYCGGYHTNPFCCEANNFVSAAIGLYSANKQIEVYNTTRINCMAKSWGSKDCDYKSTPSGGGVVYATGVMYKTGTECVPAIGGGVNITAQSRYLNTHNSDNDRKILVPGLTNAQYSNFGTKNNDNDEPKAMYRLSCPVVEVVDNRKNMEKHTDGSEADMSKNNKGVVHQKWWTNGGYFGENNAYPTNEDKMIYPVSTTFVSETVNREYYNRTNPDYQATCNEQLIIKRNTDDWTNFASTFVTNGAEGQSSGQAIVCYRFVDKKGTPLKVGFSADDMGQGVIATPLELTVKQGASYSGGLINGKKNSYKLNQSSYMTNFFKELSAAKAIRVNIPEFTARDRENPNPTQWAESSFPSSTGTSTSGATLASNKMVIIFADFVLKDPKQSYISVWNPGTQTTTDKSQWTEGETEIHTGFTGQPITESAFDLWFFDAGTQSATSDDDSQIFGLVSGTDYTVEYKGSGVSHPDTEYTTQAPTQPGSYAVRVTLHDQTDWTVAGSRNISESTKVFTLVIDPSPAQFTQLSRDLQLPYGETLGQKYANFNSIANSYFRVDSPDAVGTFSIDPTDANRIYPVSSTPQTAKVIWTPAPGSTYSSSTFSLNVVATPATLKVVPEETYVNEGARTCKFKFTVEGIIPQDLEKAQDWQYNFLVQYPVGGNFQQYDRSFAVGQYQFKIDPVAGIIGDGVENYTFTDYYSGTLNVRAITRHTVDPTLTITGNMKVGQTISAEVGNINGNFKELVAYQWYTVTEDGEFEIIDGATSRQYVIQAKDEGKFMGVAIYALEDDTSSEALVIRNYNELVTIRGLKYECLTYDSPTMVTAKKLSFLEKLLNWIRRFIAAITGMVLGSK